MISVFTIWCELQQIGVSEIGCPSLGDTSENRGEELAILKRPTCRLDKEPFTLKRTLIVDTVVLEVVRFVVEDVAIAPSGCWFSFLKAFLNPRTGIYMQDHYPLVTRPGK